MKNTEMKIRLRELVFEYYGQQQAEMEIAVEKARLRREIEQILDDLKRDTMDFKLDDRHKIRVSRFVSTKVEYDVRILYPILKAKNLVKKVCEVVVNPKKLEAAYNAGLIDFIEVEKAAIVKQSKVFRVQKIKAVKEGV